MSLELVKAKNNDARAIFDIQIKAFEPLLNKYQDFSTNPANESIDRVYQRINHPNGGFYKITVDDEIIGAISVFKQEKVHYWISPMFILPEFQGKGYAQKAIKLLEDQFSEAETWQLATLLEEKGNCYLYEKLGYKRTGATKIINENATLVYYKKCETKLSQ